MANGPSHLFHLINGQIELGVTLGVLKMVFRARKPEAATAQGSMCEEHLNYF